jgi:hypothetical protein
MRARQMKLKSTATGEGLDTYVSQKHFHPLHTLLSIAEAALMLAGAVAVILFVSQGSFASAGEKADQVLQSVTQTVTGLASHTQKKS